MSKDRQRKLLNALCPFLPYEDATQILESAPQGSKKTLPPSVGLWLTLVAHIRHRHTDYDRLLEEGYDRDAARHFTREAINAVLKKWGCRREVTAEEV